MIECILDKSSYYKLEMSKDELIDIIKVDSRIYIDILSNKYKEPSRLKLVTVLDTLRK